MRADTKPSNSTTPQPSALSRRKAFKSVGGALALTTLTLAASSAEPESVWKTAIGLNGFQSGSRKYKKNYPIWEVLDFASRHGFDGVELVADWPAGGYPAANEPERIQALRRL